MSSLYWISLLKSIVNFKYQENSLHHNIHLNIPVIWLSRRVHLVIVLPIVQCANLENNGKTEKLTHDCVLHYCCGHIFSYYWIHVTDLPMLDKVISLVPWHNRKTASKCQWGKHWPKQMPSYGYRNPHYKPKTVWRPSKIYNGNPYANKMVFS